MLVEEIKKNMKGSWISISPEIRTSASKNENGSAKPFYLTREFEYKDNDAFTLAIVNSADPYGKIPLAKIFIAGHMSWEGEHPIAPGAQKVNFTADEAYEVTPLVQGFADLLNKVAAATFKQWEVGQAQSVFNKNFLPFGLTEGNNFKEFDLVYILNNTLFWGARHVDGRGFDTEENRPTNLQIPLIRKP